MLYCIAAYITLILVVRSLWAFPPFHDLFSQLPEIFAPERGPSRSPRHVQPGTPEPPTTQFLCVEAFVCCFLFVKLPAHFVILTFAQVPTLERTSCGGIYVFMCVCLHVYTHM